MSGELVRGYGGEGAGLKSLYAYEALVDLPEGVSTPFILNTSCSKLR